jgi:hypothetical protein
MRFALSNSHYAAAWPIEETYEPDFITGLGIRYAALPPGAEREDVMFQIVRCFHAYLLKYADMIQRGHLPIYRGRVSQDSATFLSRFLRPGDAPTRANLQQACRTLYVAFGRQGFDEVYNILVGILIRTIDAYDPEYTAKIRAVAEAIEQYVAADLVITGDELELPFPPRRYLKWMARNGILEAIRDPRKKRSSIVGFRVAEWPPKQSVLNAKPIGLTYHIQKWFGHYLQAYITRQMKELETREGVMQLEHRRQRSGGSRGGDLLGADLGVPCAAGSGHANPRSGRQYAFDAGLAEGELDVSRMTLRWVAHTRDPLFSKLTRYERQLLYLYFAQERTWKEIARTCHKGIKTVQDDYLRILSKIRRKAGVASPCPEFEAA